MFRSQLRRDSVATLSLNVTCVCVNEFLNYLPSGCQLQSIFTHLKIINSKLSRTLLINTSLWAFYFSLPKLKEALLNMYV